MKNGTKKSFIIFLSASMMLMLLFGAIAQEEAPPRLVTTEWLENNMFTPDIRVVDVRDSVTAYWLEHIPSAVYLSPDAIKWPDGGVPMKLIPPRNLRELLENMGISDKTTVIIYSEKADYKAPYLQWALDYLGHKNSSILDGGFSKWKNEGRHLSQDYPKIRPAKYNYSIVNEVRIGLDQVKEAISSDNAILLDVRPAELYTGEKGNWKRKGHIKGAINRFWGLDLNEDGTWKSKDELKKAYEEIGATPDKMIIVSCGQGSMSAHSYFTLKHILGYPNVMNYDGSFNEWSNIDELPIETGSNP